MQQGRIVIITGSPGTGKSTVADKAAMESDMEKSVCIRTDDFFHYLKKGAIPPHLPESNAQNGVVIEDQLNEVSKTKGDYNRMITIYSAYKNLIKVANTKISG